MRRSQVPSGFRFVDMAILASVFQILPCKECCEYCLVLQEQTAKRKGCASRHLVLICPSIRVGGKTEEFFISYQKHRAFHVNRRLVDAMGSIDCGRAAAKRFCWTNHHLQGPLTILSKTKSCWKLSRMLHLKRWQLVLRFKFMRF